MKTVFNMMSQANEYFRNKTSELTSYAFVKRMKDMGITALNGIYEALEPKPAALQPVRVTQEAIRRTPR